MGQSALAVGMPQSSAPEGWRWVKLSEVARMESGHTPSRKQKNYWGGDIPWVSIRDAKAHHGGTIRSTLECTNELGIANSSARVLPPGTVCMSRTASVGYVVVLDRAMATSQDFANWICSKKLEPRFLQYLLIAEGRSLASFSSGAVHQTIYYPELKAFHVCLPTAVEQRRIVAILDEAFANIATATANAKKNLANAQELATSFYDRVLEAESDYATIDLADAVDRSCSLSYGIVQPGNEVDNGLPVVRPVDMKTKTVGLEGLKRIDAAAAASYKRTELKGGEILLCVRGTTGVIAVASSDLIGANVTRGIVPIRFDASKVDQQFGYHLLRSDNLRRQISAATYGTALMQINIRDVRKLKLRVPGLGRQRELGEKLDELAAKTERLEQIVAAKLKSFGLLRQSLLRRAFSGELIGDDQVKAA